ncbi:hypothetical protein G7046_g3357 [Stylonectria norvegica]|nr:hypothetical protein G7046_g3357 [Stylonectria norvegica]
MFPYTVQEDSGTRPLSEDDQQMLMGLVRRYGVSSIVCALSGLGNSSRASTFSATTLLSNTSAPSLAWSSSEASHDRSDAASMRTQSTWQETVPDVPSIHDADVGKLPERTWLDSPAAAIQSPMTSCDVTSDPSPRHVVPTSKKYQCPMCFLDNNPVGFGRKSDFKKHLYNFHGADVTWICRTKGCHLSFATERAYSTHSKETHRMDALPNSAAKTDLCPQVVFGCGFATCKDRLFEAQNNDQATSSRDKYFEHIAKHFEDGFDVNDWEYRVQLHNLMRQQKVKSIWKTCIWPKEKRQALTWMPRSSGDLKRMLEARHLGEDISTLVRLAFILGTSPFINPTTPPPSEIDLQFQLPVRNECLMDTVGHADGVRPKVEDAPTVTISKQRPQTPQSMTMSNRRVKQETRPSTPADALPEPMIRDDLAAGPHPGTPFPIPNEHVWPVDAPKFAPDQMHDQMNTFADAHMTYILPGQELPQQWNDMSAVHQYQQDEVMTNVYMPPHPGQPINVRPATPIPTKRPISWGKRLSLENLRPKKKASVYGSPASDTEAVPPVPAMYAADVTSMPHGYDLPMRMNHSAHGYTSNPNNFMPHAHMQQLGSPGTFYLDDGDVRL